MTVRAATTTADVVPAFGMRAVGGFGLRGWRVHCPECGYLSTRVLTSHRATERAQRKHRCQLEIGGSRA